MFASALLAARRFHADEGSVGGWLLGIAKNKLRESQRRKRVESSARRRLSLEPFALTDADIERIEATGASDEVLALLDELPEDQRAAIVDHVIGERSYPEIASGLHCSEAVVRQRVSRGLRTLRHLLEGTS